MVTEIEKNNFFRSLFHVKKNLPSKKLSKIFKNMFPEAINAEWHEKNDHYEIIFYENDIEKIAEFDKKGNRISLKTNLNPLFFKDDLKLIAEKYGEIMNTILIEKENSSQYEIIVRDKELIRYLLIMDEHGNITKNEKL